MDCHVLRECPIVGCGRVYFGSACPLVVPYPRIAGGGGGCPPVGGLGSSN